MVFGNAISLEIWKFKIARNRVFQKQILSYLFSKYLIHYLDIEEISLFAKRALSVLERGGWASSADGWMKGINDDSPNRPSDPL